MLGTMAGEVVETPAGRLAGDGRFSAAAFCVDTQTEDERQATTTSARTALPMLTPEVIMTLQRPCVYKTAFARRGDDL